MKKIILITYLSIVFFSCENKYKYDNNGKITVEYVNDEKVDSILYFYYSDEGLLEKTYKYKRGILTDTLTYFYKDGSIEQYRTFENGVAHGNSVLYYPSGDTMSLKKYLNGIMIYHNLYASSSGLKVEEIWFDSINGQLLYGERFDSLSGKLFDRVLYPYEIVHTPQSDSVNLNDTFGIEIIYKFPSLLKFSGNLICTVNGKDTISLNKERNSFIFKEKCTKTGTKTYVFKMFHNKNDVNELQINTAEFDVEIMVVDP